MLDNVVLQGTEERKIKVSVSTKDLERGLWKTIGLERVYDANIALEPDYNNLVYREEQGCLVLYKDLSYHGSHNWKRCDSGHICDSELVEVYNNLKCVHQYLMKISKTKEENQ